MLVHNLLFFIRKSFLGYLTCLAERADSYTGRQLKFLSDVHVLCHPEVQIHLRKPEIDWFRGTSRDYAGNRTRVIQITKPVCYQLSHAGIVGDLSATVVFAAVVVKGCFFTFLGVFGIKIKTLAWWQHIRVARSYIDLFAVLLSSLSHHVFFCVFLQAIADSPGTASARSFVDYVTETRVEENFDKLIVLIRKPGRTLVLLYHIILLH